MRQKILEKSKNYRASPAEQAEKISQNLNVIILSIPSCGLSIFQKKIFNIHKNYAELVDVQSRTVDIHIDYCNVMKRMLFLGTNIVFIMNDGKMILIKAISGKNYQLAEQVLSRLM